MEAGIETIISILRSLSVVVGVGVSSITVLLFCILVVLMHKDKE